MPTIYNACKYNQAKYSSGNLPNKQGHLYYGSCIAGIEVRGQIGKRWIYRCRPGNGYYDSKVGVIYQDRYKYFVPSTIMHPNGDNARACFANAVAGWATLPADEKQGWKDKAKNYQAMPGRNLYIRDYMTRNYP